MNRRCNEISLDEGALMAALTETAKQGLFMEGEALLAVMRRKPDGRRTAARRANRSGGGRSPAPQPHGDSHCKRRHQHGLWLFPRQPRGRSAGDGGQRRLRQRRRRRDRPRGPHGAQRLGWRIERQASLAGKERIRFAAGIQPEGQPLCRECRAADADAVRRPAGRGFCRRAGQHLLRQRPRAGAIRRRRRKDAQDTHMARLLERRVAGRDLPGRGVQDSAADPGGGTGRYPHFLLMCDKEVIEV